MLQSIGDYAKCQRLGGRQRLFPGASINGDAGQRRNIGDPASIVFARKFNLQVERFRLSRFFHFNSSLTDPNSLQ